MNDDEIAREHMISEYERLAHDPSIAGVSMKTHQDLVDELAAQMEDREKPTVEFFLDDGDRVVELVITEVKFNGKVIKVDMEVF